MRPSQNTDLKGGSWQRPVVECLPGSIQSPAPLREEGEEEEKEEEAESGRGRAKESFIVGLSDCSFVSGDPGSPCQSPAAPCRAERESSGSGGKAPALQYWPSPAHGWGGGQGRRAHFIQAVRPG